MLVDEPRTTGIDFRDASFGIFRTLTPRIRIECPSSRSLEGIRVVIEGRPGTDEASWLDITMLFKSVSAGAALEAEIPTNVAGDALQGANHARRAHPDTPTSLQIVTIGENNIRVQRGDVLLTSVFFLCYDNDRWPISSPIQATLDYPGGGQIGANRVLVRFNDPNTSDESMSKFLAQHGLRPQGAIWRERIVQARADTSGDLTKLLALIEQLRTSLGDRGDVLFEPLGGPVGPEPPGGR